MRRIAFPILMLGLAVTPFGGEAQVAAPIDSLEARIWLDRGEEPVVQYGDDVRVYYRASADAHVAVFRIDTDGEISLVFPQHPGVSTQTTGQRDYRLLFADAPRWRVRAYVKD